MTDPEDVTQLRQADLEEVEIAERPNEQRPVPIEADPADVADQRIEVPIPDEDDEDV
jgi:hypothetical protein